MNFIGVVTLFFYRNRSRNHIRFQQPQHDNISISEQITSDDFRDPPPTYSSSISFWSDRIRLSSSSFWPERDHHLMVTKVSRARRVNTK